jgi:hypothetical protein
MLDNPTDNKASRPRRIGDELVWGSLGVAEEIKKPDEKIESAIHRARYLIRTKRIRVSRPPGARGFFTTRKALAEDLRGPGD